jgi:hypothetical protein
VLVESEVKNREKGKEKYINEQRRRGEVPK